MKLLDLDTIPKTKKKIMVYSLSWRKLNKENLHYKLKLKIKTFV